MSKPGHHQRNELCLTRAPYREGRKPTAVRVYTVNQESKYLLVQGVPTVGAKAELVELFGSHGDIKEVRTLDEYPSERFTEVYLINYKRIQSARLAKRRLDDWSFYGGVLHVCYAPEYETVQDTREKMQERRKTIATKIRQYNRDGIYTTNSTQNKTSSSESCTIISNESQSTSYPEQNQLNGTTYMKLTQDEVQGQKTCYDSAASDMPSVSSYAHANSSNSASIPLSYMNQSAGQSSGLADNRSTHAGQSIQTSQDSQPNSSQLQLPPPPRHSKSINPQNNQPGQKYTFAKVPSAQATFSPDFDARLKHIPTSKPSNASDYDDKSDTSSDINEHVNESDENSNEEVEKTMQEKINDNLKSNNVVIKNYAKQGPTPKFIPRQMQSKAKFSVKPKDEQQTKTNDKDEVSKELKRNAFTLRGMQGPVDPEQEKMAGPELQISSVEKSVKEIRKHVSQLSDRNLTEIPPKRQKMKES